ncbi:unnamed protein product, partial [Leptidea sinapis]
MEEELRCYLCKEFYREPVLLPCGHSLCRVCAVSVQTHVHDNDNASAVASDYQEADKASVSSETDSGVVCGSRPNSYAGTTAAPVYSSTAFSITCPVCSKQVLLDENGAEGLPPFRVMRTIVERFGGINIAPPAEEACQMCEGERRAAIVRCEQCSVRYCAGCRDAWHPIRGPLAQHELRALGTTCIDHGLSPVLYCNTCLIPICPRCLNERHSSHETQPLSNAARAHKTELSQSLQQLSEEAKAVTEYIQLVKGSGEKINESCEELERQIDQACAEITRAVERRRDELVRAARNTRSQAATNMRSLTGQAAQKLREATALLHFSIEALKETDNAAFLQVGNLLSVRAQDTASGLRSSLESPPSPPALTLDIEPVIRTVKTMNFIECIPPGAPEMAVEACAARGCSCTLAWRPPAAPHSVRGYILELDDGLGGPFREVYCGRETVCTVDGLHYASLYSARVKAFNGAGEGPYSEVIGLQTSPEGGLVIGAEGLSARAGGWQPRVVVADQPLARGVHYWRLRVDRYDGDADPAFGVARHDGDIAFTGLRGAFYPAVSLNRGVAVTLQPGLPPPPDMLMSSLSIE